MQLNKDLDLDLDINPWVECVKVRHNGGINSGVVQMR